MSGLSNLRALLEDERVWCVAARVAVLEGDAKHYEVNEEGDMTIGVVTLQHGVPIRANLDSLSGSGGNGIWMIPDVNDEVIVAFDGGEFEGEAYIVGRTCGGTQPGDGELGPLAPRQIFVVGERIEVRASDKVLIAAPTVEAASAAGGGRRLAFHDELQALWSFVRDQFSPTGHSHAAPGGATTSTVAIGTTPDEPVGTGVIKGE